MPLIDMPIEELKVYAGRNPKPADFDQYWHRAVTEMEAIDPEIELIPVDFQNQIADCHDLYFTGIGGARIYAKLLRPKNCSTPHPAVIQFHGYGGNSGNWHDKLSYVAAGYTVAALDCRGQGGKSEDVGGVTGNTLSGHIIRGLDDKPEKLFLHMLYLDAAQLARIVMAMDDVDEKRVGAMGGSQGGGLTLACASLTPELKFAAPVYPGFCDYKRVWEMAAESVVYDEIKYYFRNFDPRHNCEDETFAKLGYIDLQHLVPRIKAKVRMYVGLMDTVCLPSSQFAAYNKIVAEKEMVIYPDFAHENLPGAGDDTFGFMMGL